MSIVLAYVTEDFECFPRRNRAQYSILICDSLAKKSDSSERSLKRDRHIFVRHNLRDWPFSQSYEITTRFPGHDLMPLCFYLSKCL